MYQQPRQQCQEAPRQTGSWSRRSTRTTVKRRPAAHIGLFPADCSHAQLWFLSAKQTNASIVRPPFEFPQRSCPEFRGGDSLEWKVVWEKEEKTDVLFTSQFFIFMNDLNSWRNSFKMTLQHWGKGHFPVQSSSSASYPILRDKLSKMLHQRQNRNNTEQ